MMQLSSPLAAALTALIPPALLAALAWWRKALTPSGLALAWALAVVICLCGGLGAFWVLAAVFVFTIAAGKLSKRIREPIEALLHAKGGRRDAVQIFCNVFTGAGMLLLRTLTGRDGFLWAYGGAMAASLADSMASELGVLSRRPPRDILTLRVAEKGLSGAVSCLGLAASALGAAIAAALCFAAWGGEQGAGLFFAVLCAGFLAALADSVLGAALQAKYRCPVCRRLTERRNHCDVQGTLERGLALITNDTVNLCNNLIGALSAGLWWSLTR